MFHELPISSRLLSTVYRVTVLDRSPRVCETALGDTMTKRKLIIDCDAGIDDAQAILLALSQDVEVLAITCVAGNTPIDNVCVNVLKVLEVCNRTDIPVFKGATGPLLGKKR